MKINTVFQNPCFIGGFSHYLLTTCDNDMMMTKMMLLFMTYIISIYATSSSIGFGVHKLKQFHAKGNHICIFILSYYFLI
jgi:hypothetical protein